MKNKHIVIGYLGEVGQSIYKLLRENNKLDVMGIDQGKYILKQKYEYMHICIPYSDDFIKIIKAYQKHYNPKYVIVYSTVLPGTCRKLGGNVVHSPVEGQHPNLLNSIKTFKRLISGNKSKIISKLFESFNIETVCFNKPEITELGKLLSTTRYGINLVFAQQQQDLCDKFKVGYFETVIKYQEMYNIGYIKVGRKRFIQPMLIPPGNKIGGHCVIPNAKLLATISESNYIKELVNYGTGKN